MQQTLELIPTSVLTLPCRHCGKPFEEGDGCMGCRSCRRCLEADTEMKLPHWNSKAVFFVQGVFYSPCNGEITASEAFNR